MKLHEYLEEHKDDLFHVRWKGELSTADEIIERYNYAHGIEVVAEGGFVYPVSGYVDGEYVWRSTPLAKIA